jgi:hypothetical protein
MDKEREESVTVNFAEPQSPEIRAWKDAHAMMWQRWQEFIDFGTLKQRHLKMPFEGRLDVLFDAIGMLYGEYLTEHINEYRELEAQLLEKYRGELR